ncbi:hypothetical protein Pa4123_13750 [Phytohabitans aurantiacus]|uniref:Uncharacterized protein n=1 Tax=Phytohabitans aurantiacus TaxID=3016789 RepID=A0ABQ5QQE0_9ACTN|nr:hypothetical protein Pa4123_13750 [Phytohabitans aurantiacus]
MTAGSAARRGKESKAIPIATTRESVFANTFPAMCVLRRKPFPPRPAREDYLRRT